MQLDQMCILETERLILTLPDIEHSNDVFEYSSDKGFCKHISALPPESVRDSEAFIKSLIKDNNSGKRCYWMIHLKETNNVIGTIGYIFDDSQNIYTPQIGYGISRKQWGKGVFNEAAIAILRYGQDTLGIKNVFVVTRSDNKRSINGAKKLGFTDYKIISDYYISDGASYDAHVLIKECV